MFTPSAMFAVFGMTPNSLCFIPGPCTLFNLPYLLSANTTNTAWVLNTPDHLVLSGSGVLCLGSYFDFLSNQIWLDLLTSSLLLRLNTELCVCVLIVWMVLKCSGCTLYLCFVLSPVCWWHPGVDMWDGSSPHTRSSRCGQKAWFEKKKIKKDKRNVCGIVTI